MVNVDQRKVKEIYFSYLILNTHHHCNNRCFCNVLPSITLPCCELSSHFLADPIFNFFYLGIQDSSTQHMLFRDDNILWIPFLGKVVCLQVVHCIPWNTTCNKPINQVTLELFMPSSCFPSLWPSSVFGCCCWFRKTRVWFDHWSFLFKLLLEL